MEKLLEIKEIKKNFDNVEVLKGIDLDVYPQDIIAIIGPSGSGKSTFLRCINNLETPDEGIVLFEGKNINDKKTNINLIRENVTMVFQSFNLFENMNVLKNCTIAQEKVQKKEKKESEETAIKYLTQVGMEKFLHANPKKLSGGQKQRVAIARALCMHPKVILFDEPTSALDPEMVSEVLQVMRKLRDMGMTMIIVTHEIQFAREVANKIVFISEGKVIESGCPEEIFSSPKNEKTKQFLKRYIN